MAWISQYKVDDVPIGEGGMGRILHGYDPEGHEVAIKEILPEFSEDIEMRFRISQEMRFLERLNYDNVVKIYDSFMLQDRFYIVMELVKGLNIEQWVTQNGKFDEQGAAKCMVSILDAMQYVHEQQVVHRDLKPSNIMIRPDGSICLLDFGIAKDMSLVAKGSSHTTAYGTVIGSDGYMSPEQAMGDTIDYRSDIYSLGCVLFFMLTGHHAFPHIDNPQEMLKSVIDKPFPKLSKYVKTTTPQMQQIMNRATDKNMMKRYMTCREFKNALNSIANPKQNSQATHISASMADNRCVVTLGREGCDICFNDPSCNVSRHHAEIELKVFTGGSFYIFRDNSSNGSIVNNNKVHHMAYHIPCAGPLPNIYLAGDPSQMVDWNVVTEMLKQKKAAIDARIRQQETEIGKSVDHNDPVGKTTIDDTINLVDEDKDLSLWQRILRFFNS